MKKIRTQVFFLIVAACLFVLPGCRSLSELPETQSISAQTQASPSAAATATQPPPIKTPAQTAAAMAILPESLSVIADGEVCGGYLDGKWLTQNEAAQYLTGRVAFQAYNLLGDGVAVESHGVSYSEDDYTYGYTGDFPNSGNGVYELDIDDWWDGDAQSYTEDPLEYYYLYHTAQECLPEITLVEDTSAVKSVIQDMLDEHFGKDAPEAEIIIAVNADIDADGEQEMVVNAANDEQNVYEYYADKPLYCISCVIESSGEVAVIDEYYLDAETAVSQYNEQLSAEYFGYDEEVEDSEYEEGDEIAFYTDIRFFYIQNIIDLDHDGVCEFVLIWEAWEVSDMLVLKYDGKTADNVLCYGWGV